MFRNVLPIKQTWARLLSSVPSRTLASPARIPASRPSGAARIVLAATMASAVGLTLIAGAPDRARAESPDGLTYIVLSPGASEARYIMHVQSLGQSPKPAICTTRDINGQIVLTAAGGVVPELSQLTVNQRSLRCAAPLRDDMAQKVLQTAQHPLSTFAAQSAPGLTAPLTPSEQSYQMIGDQVVRGVTRSVAYDSTGTFTGETFAGSSRAVLKMSDFGISPPNLGPLLSVADEMIAEIDIKAAMSASPTPAAEGTP